MQRRGPVAIPNFWVKQRGEILLTLPCTVTCERNVAVHFLLPRCFKLE
jgi:hypothetical protein